MDRVCNRCGRKIKAHEWAWEDVREVSMGYGPTDLIPAGHVCLDCIAIEELASGHWIMCADCEENGGEAAIYDIHYGEPLGPRLLAGWGYEAVEDWQDFDSEPILYYCPICVRDHERAKIYRP